MKGRPKSLRRISSLPAVSGFSPIGGEGRDSEAVVLYYEEYEALRLNDYEKNSQCESAAFMGISRPTFTRIYMSAREKIAKAFVEHRSIIVEGGSVEVDDHWLVCNDCHAVFSNVQADGIATNCALCGSTNIAQYRLQHNITNQNRGGNNPNRTSRRNGYRHNDFTNNDEINQQNKS